MRMTGTCLNAGGYKECREIIGEPNKVALVPRSWYSPTPQAQKELLTVERSLLEQLEAAGVPVLRTSLELVKSDPDGSEAWALVADKYDWHAKPGYRFDFEGLTEEHVDTLDLIAIKLRSAKLYVGDPQFLFKKGGEVVIADPNTIDPEPPTGNWAADNIQQWSRRMRMELDRKRQRRLELEAQKAREYDAEKNAASAVLTPNRKAA
jgi:hypothetical protein